MKNNITETVLEIEEEETKEGENANDVYNDFLFQLKRIVGEEKSSGYSPYRLFILCFYENLFWEEKDKLNKEITALETKFQENQISVNKTTIENHYEHGKYELKEEIKDGKYELVKKTFEKNQELNSLQYLTIPNKTKVEKTVTKISAIYRGSKVRELVKVNEVKGVVKSSGDKVSELDNIQTKQEKTAQIQVLPPSPNN